MNRKTTPEENIYIEIEWKGTRKEYLKKEERKKKKKKMMMKKKKEVTR